MQAIAGYWSRSSLWRKSLVCFLLALLIILVSSYGIAEWYIIRHKNEPLKIGATFIPDYARQLGVDPQETLQAAIDDLGIRRFRLVSYWDDIERTPGVYDFSELDWQFQKIEAAGGQVALAIGLRQPRWPECHGPDWAMSKPKNEWSEDLKVFMKQVIDRYKGHTSLVEYQLENEYFMNLFGKCPDFSRSRLIDEFNFVSSLDTQRPVIISRSNNTYGWPVRGPVPDMHAISVYKRVWDKTITKRYFEYPYPAWYYAFYGGISELTQKRPFMIHELQTEAWLPDGYDMATAPIDELYKSLSPERLATRIDYGVATGIRTMDLWGIEWWYQMKTKRNAPELWDTAKERLVFYRQ